MFYWTSLNLVCVTLSLYNDYYFFESIAGILTNEIKGTTAKEIWHDRPSLTLPEVKL